MIIKRLTLKNYRRFRSLDLEVPENIIGILGRNGSGKTTIVESIGWCLYGNRIRRTDKQDIPSQFCSPKDVTAVTLEFELQGENYRIHREMRGKSAIVEAAIYRGDLTEPIAVQERGVNEMVDKLLNLDYRSFFISVFARQKDLAALSMFRPEERKKSIARLINIDAIERARKEVRTDRNIKSEKKTGMESHLVDEKELKERKAELENDLKSTEENLEKQKKSLVSLQKEWDAAKKDFETQAKKREQFLQIKAQIENKESLKKEFEIRKDQLGKELDQILAAKKEYEEQKDKLKEFERVQRKKDKLDRESSRFSALQAYREELKRIDIQIKREEVKLAKLIEEIKGAGEMQALLKKIEGQIDELEKQTVALREKRLESKGKLTSIKNKGMETRNKKEKIENLGPESPCPVCTRPLRDHYDKVIEQFNAELQDLREQYVAVKSEDEEIVAKLTDAESQLKKMQQERDLLLQNLEQFRQRQKQREESDKDLENYKAQSLEVEKKISALGKVDYDEKTHSEIKKKFKELSQIRDTLLRHEEKIKRHDQVKEDFKRVNLAIEQYQAEIKQESEKLESLGYDETLFSNLKKNVEEKQKLVEEAKEKIHQLEQQKLAIQKDLQHLTSEIKKNKQIREQIAEMQQEIAYLNALDYHFGIFRQELSGRIRPMIAARASELLHLTTHGRYSILELDEDYNIFLYDQTQKFPLARFSGGEQDLANLCLRIAISQVVAERSGRSQINFIVLDEIFGSQDEERRELIMTALQQLSTQFRQIFIITHIESIKDSFPVVIAVKEKSELESEAVLI